MEREKVFIIGEAGVNHNGDPDVAIRLVECAARAGCDAVKFQTFDAAELATVTASKAEYQKANTDERQSQYEMLRQLALPVSAYKPIVETCDALGIRFLSTAFSIEALRLLLSLGMSVIKIPSGEITNLPFLEQVGAVKRPIILSTGMANMAEIGSALDILEKAGTARSQITILHCTTAYPTCFEDVNLSAMLSLKEQFGTKVGYSDHTRGVEIPLAAVAMGASIIEKHFTLDTSQSGPDHAASLDPEQLEAMVTGIRRVEQALGDGVKRAMPGELDNMKVARRSLVAARDISAGEIFDKENVTAKRPGTGVSPMRYYELLGTPARQDYSKDQLIEI